MQESLLYERWKNLALSSETIYCGPDTLQVIEAGELSLACGPDFRSARFRLNGVVYQGDVECHSREKDWYRHQHHLDRAYANVLLHIIPREVSPAEHVLHHQSKRMIPTIGIPAQTQAKIPTACPLKQMPESTLTELGLERFRLKMHYYATQKFIHSPEQVFYEGLLRALGYTANTEPFHMLTRRLSWSWLHTRLQQGIRAADLLAIYAGIAGFLPSVSKEPFLNNLIQRYQQQENVLDAAPMQPEIWQFAGIRPFNHPHFRLAGWVMLVQKNKNPMSALQTLFEQRLPSKYALTQIQKFFNIPCPAYWQKHYGFDLPRKGLQARFFFGQARIIEILQNILLPFFAVSAQKSGSSGFLSYLEDLFCQLPAAAGYGILQRHFPLVWCNQKGRPSLALYQGLLYLKQYFCDSGRCNACPINHKRTELLDNF